jgi:Dolichyl-phosphate-mannose-protein mannosyltransferase
VVYGFIPENGADMLLNRVNRAELSFVMVVLLFAAGLRLIGVENGMPDESTFPTLAAHDLIPDQVAVQPDEFLFVVRPYRMLVTRRFNPHYFENPSLLINLNFFTYLFSGEGKGVTSASWKGINEREEAPFRFYVIGRVYSALGGLLAVAAIYALMRWIGGRRAALFAGLLVAVAEPLVQHAHYTTSTSLAGGFAALALWAAIVSLYRPRGRLFALAGIAAGLAAGSRYNAAAISLVVFAVGLLLLYRHHLRWTLVLIGWLLVPVTFTLTTPHVIFDSAQVLSDFRYITAQYINGVGIDFTTPYGLFFEYRYLILFGFGVPAALTLLIGLYAAWRTRPRYWLRENSAWLVVLMLATYIVPYSLVVLRTARPGHSDQLLVPVIPAFALIVGIGAAYIARRWQHLTPLLALVLILVPLALSVQLVRQFTRTDTRYQMQAWIYDHLPRGSRIQLNGPYNVPLDPSLYKWTQNYGGDLKPLSDLRAEGVDYAVLSDAWYHDEERSHEIVPAEYLQQLHNYLATYQALPMIARLDRPALLGNDWMTYTASVWHNPGLTVYCLTPESCAAVQ